MICTMGRLRFCDDSTKGIENGRSPIAPFFKKLKKIS